MKKKYHLRRGEDIGHILKFGKKYHSAYFNIMRLPNTIGHGRFAFIVSRGTDKRAVARNKIRRRVREWIRKSPELISLSMDMVFIMNKEAVKAGRKLLYEELSRFVQKTVG